MSINNKALGVGVEVVIGAGLTTTQMKKENSSSDKEEQPHIRGVFVFLPIRIPHKAFEKKVRFLFVG